MSETAESKYTFETFRNGTSHKFDDISSETYREYVYPDYVLRIDNPLALNVNFSSGGHRVFDAQGVSHYIPKGYREIRWEVKEGFPHYVK